MSSAAGEDRTRASADSTLGDWEEQVARRRIRIVLSASALLVVLVMLLPILASFTSVLNGTVGGVGVGYIAGFAEYLVALGGAIAYCRWANRAAGRSDAPELP
jgi:uncharacterized membrane protein (DUF485 family)